MRFKLGDRVVFTQVLRKSKGYGKTTYQKGAMPTQKKRDGLVQEEYNSGILIGTRVVFDWDIDYDLDYGAISRQIPDSGRRVWLVAYRLDRNPVMVLDEHIQLLEDSDDCNT